ncbi:MAG: glycosyltransferase family 2 protein, partial [Candidatus Omnitrophica bacterium]|nr:glycosyltransferase family 2 protein [Candidatus Omnitrophota bacterium]
DYGEWLRIARKVPVGLIERPYVIKYGGHADQRSRQFSAMDRFRIQSLVNILKSGVLNPEQEKATRKMLKIKSGIYILGALKRGLKEEAQIICELLQEIHLEPDACMS